MPESFKGFAKKLFYHTLNSACASTFIGWSFLPEKRENRAKFVNLDTIFVIV